MTKEILLITFNRENDDNVELKKINEINGITAIPALRNVNLFLKIVRRIDMSLPFPLFMNRWLTELCLSNLDSYDALICIAHRWSPKILTFLNKKKKYLCINYFWDKISVSKYPVKDSAYFQNWSFNRSDAKKYGMRFNPQFFLDTILLPNNIEYDISFVGSDRSGEWRERSYLLKELFNIFKENDISALLYYVTAEKTEPYMHSKLLSMSEYLETIAKGKAILELVQPGDGWITERVFLAMHNRRKLITNNMDIVNEDFYRKENIFVFGKDDVKDLKRFLNSDFNDDISIDYYLIKNWRDRFFVDLSINN